MPSLIRACCEMQGTDEHPRTHRTSQIPPDDGFYGDDFRFLHKHRAFLELVPVLLHLFWHLVDVDCDEVVRDDMLELSKPEQGYARQQLPLFWDALWIGLSLSWPAEDGGKKVTNIL